ncbi:MAG: hypothetical protein HYY65_02860 [Candidatus Tectomicrobia bacterium]|uniref:Uncharacterized protein n=1 Tax=Tectimicrobiota bacterium TaxID=2528274 RepID=A0A932GNB1_UNCTE|nr:hypothetical protein [Candidatus Tectomicrobia bacterium]
MKSAVKFLRMLGVECKRKPGGLLVYSKEELGKAFLRFLASSRKLRETPKSSTAKVKGSTGRKLTVRSKSMPTKRKVPAKTAAKGVKRPRTETAYPEHPAVLGQKPSAVQAESHVPLSPPSPALQLRHPLIKIRRIVQ